MKREIFCSGVSFSGRGYAALRELEKAYPEMTRSELIGRALLIAMEMAYNDPDRFCAMAYNPRGKV